MSNVETFFVSVTVQNTQKKYAPKNTMKLTPKCSIKYFTNFVGSSLGISKSPRKPSLFKINNLIGVKFNFTQKPLAILLPEFSTKRNKHRYIQLNEIFLSQKGHRTSFTPYIAFETRPTQRAWPSPHLSSFPVEYFIYLMEKRSDETIRENKHVILNNKIISPRLR